MIIGIDPGLTGGVAVLNRDMCSLYVLKVTDKFLDIEHLKEVLLKYQGAKVYLEKVHSMPKQGVASSFKFGKVLGAIMGLLSGLGFDYSMITPQAWQKAVHTVPKDEVPDPKQRSLIAVRLLFPNIDLRASNRCKIPHKGLVDALLIAEAGRLMERGRMTL